MAVVQAVMRLRIEVMSREGRVEMGGENAGRPTPSARPLLLDPAATLAYEFFLGGRAGFSMAESESLPVIPLRGGNAGGNDAEAGRFVSLVTGDFDFDLSPAVPDARRSQLDFALITDRFGNELDWVSSEVIDASEMALSNACVVIGDVGLTTSA